ncbi:MAG: hypothetical protein V4819_07550 [Verrucomicrobiota bacterium]
MSSQDPHTLTASTRSTALLVARIIFYMGLLIGIGFCAVAVGVLFFKGGNLTDPTERALVGAVLVGLGVMSFGFVAIARSRVAKLKASR